MIDDVKQWLLTTQFSNDGYFSPNGFEQSATLYDTPLGLSFVLAMIDGSADPAPFVPDDGGSRYGKLIETIRRATNNSPAYWFFGNDPDNAFSELLWIRRCDYQLASEYNLNQFETSPAPEGGVSWLGLVSGDKDWLLLHHHNPCNRFRIEVHGPAEWCSNISTQLRAG